MNQTTILVLGLAAIAFVVMRPQGPARTMPNPTGGNPSGDSDAKEIAGIVTDISRELRGWWETFTEPSEPTFDWGELGGEV